MTVRRIEVRERVMARNDELAAQVRARLAARGVTAINLMSSPGAGKTTLLERTLAELGEPLDMAVVAGDVQTQNDADRLAVHTGRLVQAIVTGGACHLDALQVNDALDHIDLDRTRLLIIENVGNLVCPASWDLGERHRVVLFTVTEGEDKPLKYPKMFEKADWVVLTKTDLLPYLPFDVDRAMRYCRQVNPRLQFLQVSAMKGDGMDAWFEFLRRAAAPSAGA
ncbi:MAG: hydrogenase nickel incorporation protein HypB [Gemmatimonadetes bacterium]|nr:hydrogenase nickel incorporation protein HypB [Gemmatimonadota bacterium]